MGPAYVKSFRLTYEGRVIGSLPSFVEACCIADGEQLSGSAAKAGLRIEAVTDTPSNLILPSGGNITVFMVRADRTNPTLWKKIDGARWHLKPEACYCSILDECFKTDFISDPVEVDACHRVPEQEYSG